HCHSQLKMPPETSVTPAAQMTDVDSSVNDSDDEICDDDDRRQRDTVGGGAEKGRSYTHDEGVAGVAAEALVGVEHALDAALVVREVAHRLEGAAACQVIDAPDRFDAPIVLIPQSF